MNPEDADRILNKLHEADIKQLYFSARYAIELKFKEDCINRGLSFDVINFISWLKQKNNTIADDFIDALVTERGLQ